MVNTRSQTAKNNSVSTSGMERHNDAESEDSLPDVLTRDQRNDFDAGNLLSYRNGTERHAVNQRFSGNNKQLIELTNFVLALTEKVCSSTEEGNGLNPVSNDRETRSDMVTGASRSNAQPNPLRLSTSQYPQSSAHQLEDFVTEIHHLRIP